MPAQANMEDYLTGHTHTHKPTTVTIRACAEGKLCIDNIAYYFIHSFSCNDKLSEVGAVHLAEGLAQCAQLEKLE